MDSLRPLGSFRSAFSGKSSPRSSPIRKLHSVKTPRRDGKGIQGSAQWLRSNRLVLWLLLITLWTYAGFYVQSKWAHGDNKEEVFGLAKRPAEESSGFDRDHRRDLLEKGEGMSAKNVSSDEEKGVKNVNKKKDEAIIMLKKKSNKVGIRLPRRPRVKQRTAVKVERGEEEEQEEQIPMNNSTYGLLVGPFGSIEDKILEWSREKRSGTCDRKGDFARLVWSRKFVLIFHELSMTGAPLAMLELATELLSCGATVSAVVLNKRGGLLAELSRRRIRVLEDKADVSFKAATKANLVIAGSASCASWIEQYIPHSIAGSGQIAWWIMENRREYFERAKGVLNRVKMIMFISEIQSNQWLSWCNEANIKLIPQHSVVPLSVNDELAFVAGIPCTLNTPFFSTQKMAERRLSLRRAVREEMGLTDGDMLVMSLSSINPGKGQMLLLEAVAMAHELGLHRAPLIQQVIKDRTPENQTTLVGGGDQPSEQGLAQRVKTDNLTTSAGNPKLSILPKKRRKKMSRGTSGLKGRKPLSESGGEAEVGEGRLKLLIGSVGSKSNKASYVRRLLEFISQHSNISKSVIWSPVTTHVASLYSAADVYAINSQGMGETFGRVTVEAMGYGLPVLGTEGGGTKEIVEHNMTGLLHPVDRTGNDRLAKNLGFLLNNPWARVEMGKRGRQKVEQMYMKRHMYTNLARVFVKCMKFK